MSIWKPILRYRAVRHPRLHPLSRFKTCHFQRLPRSLPRLFWRSNDVCFEDHGLAFLHVEARMGAAHADGGVGVDDVSGAELDDDGDGDGG